MAGKIIQIDALSGGLDQIVNRAPDVVASSNGALAHVLSADDPGYPSAGALISRTDGALIERFVRGDPQHLFAVATLASRKALVKKNSNGATVKLPVFPAGSFTVVAAVYLSAEFLASAAQVVPLAWYSVSGGVATLAYDLFSMKTATYATNPGMWQVSGFSSLRTPDPAPTVPGWRIVSLDVRIPNLAVNSADVRLSVNGALPVTATVTGFDIITKMVDFFFTVGMPNSGQGIKTNGIGDIYLFSDSLNNGGDFGIYTHDRLVAELKAYYAIA